MRTKNATIDEPSHLLSGWLQLHNHDYRLEPGNPPLWACWASLPNLSTRLKLTYDSPIWKEKSWDPEAGTIWTHRMLFKTPGNDGDAFVRRGRAMMPVFGVMLGALIGVWAFQLNGAIAAMVAVAVFSFDPNFIAHAPLVKGDVPFALVMVALAYVIWRMGKRATIWNVLGVGLLCGVGCDVKFSGVLLGPVVAMMLLARALRSEPWLFISIVLRSRTTRLLAAVGVGVVSAIICIVVAWACYGFRFRPAPPADVSMDMAAIRDRAILLEAIEANPTRRPTPAELAAWKPSLFTQAIGWMDQHHTLPQAMLAGLLYQHACVLLWPAFLMGDLYGTGRSYYYPMAMLFKTPLTTLAALAATAVFGLVWIVKWRAGHANHDVQNEKHRAAGELPRSWDTLCILIPLVIFAVAIVQSHLNVGLRSALPLYPFLYIAMGTAAATAWRRGPRPSAVLLTMGLATLMIETVSAWPDYIAFFNAGAGGSRGGISLLGDSNLDWGQDLIPLVAWQREHPDVPLYLDYFGTVDPAFYGLRFHWLAVAPDGITPISDEPMRPSILAISATHLQGLYIGHNDLAFYRRMGEQPPIATIGGTIYLYRYPLKPAAGD